ncbi:MAG: hypothetical protein RL154_695 [Pseudomonadota bacterium]|jgi:predicted ATPase
MRIKLQNIGMLSEANVKLDGLTVIAGENDTGKSTVGKALYFLQYRRSKEDDADGKLFSKVFRVKNNQFLTFGQSSGNMSLLDNDNKNLIEYTISGTRKSKTKNKTKHKVFYIESPMAMNLAQYITTSESIRSSESYTSTLPFYIFDLIMRMKEEAIESDEPENSDSIINDVISVIKTEVNGSIIYDSEKDDFFFIKDQLPNTRIPMVCTASGIKMFGFLQILLANDSLKDGSVLILDEPEVHLHPKWQLKYAEIIVELVKNGVTVLVNSHSPYMVQALKVYSDRNEAVKKSSNFYIAVKNLDQITSTIKDTTKDLNPIFKALAQPLHDIVWAK